MNRTQQPRTSALAFLSRTKRMPTASPRWTPENATISNGNTRISEESHCRNTPAKCQILKGKKSPNGNQNTFRASQENHQKKTGNAQ